MMQTIFPKKFLENTYQIVMTFTWSIELNGKSNFHLFFLFDSRYKMRILHSAFVFISFFDKKHIR
jgi:hypothetical protein